MAKYGLTSYELELNMAGLLKDVQQTAEQEETLKSIDILEDIMDRKDLGHYSSFPFVFYSNNVLMMGSQQTKPF